MIDSQCHNCKYFHGKNGITCALHPHGAVAYSCRDWEPGENDFESFNWKGALASSGRFAGAVLILGGLWFGTTSLSLAGFRYSNAQLEEANQLTTTKKVSFRAEVSKSARQVFWGTSAVGCGLILLLSLGSPLVGVMIVKAIADGELEL